MNIELILPQIFLFAWAALILIVDFVRKDGSRKGVAWLAIIGLVIACILTAITRNGEGFFGTYRSDDYGRLFNMVFLMAAILTILASIDFAEIRFKSKGEFYGLILLATTGMMFLSGAAELLTLYVSLELATIPLYVMAAYMKRDLKSTEAIQNLKVVATDVARGLILIMGAVPGAEGGFVRVTDAVKRKLPKEAPKPAAVRKAGAAAEGAAAPQAGAEEARS